MDRPEATQEEKGNGTMADIKIDVEKEFAEYERQNPGALMFMWVFAATTPTNK